MEAAAAFHRHLLGVVTDHVRELGYRDRKRIHNLKYYPWVEQQGKTAAQLDAQRHDPDYWTWIQAQVKPIDRLIDRFIRRLTQDWWRRSAVRTEEALVRLTPAPNWHTLAEVAHGTAKGQQGTARDSKEDTMKATRDQSQRRFALWDRSVSVRRRMVRFCAVLVIAVLFSLPIAAQAGWTWKFGYTACFSPRVVMTPVYGTDDHHHSHWDGGTKTFYFDLSWHTSQKSFGHTNTDWSIGALGNLSQSSSFGTCQT